jgi:hypothetical protein
MSIQDQAQQLAALAESVPSGNAEAIRGDLESLQQQIAATLGDTSSANEIQGAIGQANAVLNDLGAALEQIRSVITEKANYHLSG